MNREEARQEIRRSWRSIIGRLTAPAKRKVNGEPSYVCPICGHGEHGDGLARNPKSGDGNGLKCFGCGFSGDIIDLYMKLNNRDYNKSLFLLAQECGITIDQHKPAAAGDGRAAVKREAPAAGLKPAANVDYRAYYTECRERLEAPACAEYLEKRGISLATAYTFGVGFDPSADPAQSGHPAARVIIPTSTSHYIGRAVDPATPAAFQKLNVKGGKAGIFNVDMLYTGGEVFIVEGALDALSILEVGAEAVALNSTANVDMLIKMLEEKRTEATLLLSLDNDEAGRAATEKLRKGLQRLNIPCVIAAICGGFKDPNERLTSDREGLIEAVAAAKRQLARQPDSISQYMKSSMAHEIAAFKSDVKTGYDNLDQKCGGLYAGLYVIAAISSLGKTTFTHQLADQLATAGHDVLFFSLEQSRLELVSKSLARAVAFKNRKTAVTSLSIRKGGITEEVIAAGHAYQKAIEDRLSIIEGNFNCNISFIGDYVRRYIDKNKVKPVIIIDYLQILQPEERGRQTIKEAMDSVITELKRLSRELSITVIVISSVNRANYLTPIDFESLKESGGIEFTADVVWGMQLHCLEEDLFNSPQKIKEKRERIQEEKRKSPRNIDLVCLKNRYGISSFTCNFEYFPANDLFIPAVNINIDEDEERL